MWQPWDCLLSPIVTDGNGGAWKSWPTFSSSLSEMIKFLAQNLPSVKFYRRSSFPGQRSIVSTSKGNRELYLWSFGKKTAKLSWPGPFKCCGRSRCSSISRESVMPMYFSNYTPYVKGSIHTLIFLVRRSDRQLCQQYHWRSPLF